MIKQEYKTECYGKINLSLSITGASNGLHELDSVMATIDIKDTLTFYPGSNELEIDIFDKIGNMDKSKYILVLKKAIVKLENHFGKLQGKMVIEKGVPLGAGLGGSTATLVCIIKLFQQYFRDLGEYTDLDAQFLCEIGSDVPFMYNGGIKRVLGVGDKIQDVSLDKVSLPIYALLLYAKDGVDTKNCYKLYDELNKGKFDKPFNKSIVDIINNPTNSLEKPALQLNPEIASNMRFLKSLGVSKVAMTGSGSAIYTLSICKEELQKLEILIQKYTNIPFQIVKILNI